MEGFFWSLVFVLFWLIALVLLIRGIVYYRFAKTRKSSFSLSAIFIILPYLIAFIVQTTHKVVLKNYRNSIKGKYELCSNRNYVLNMEEDKYTIILEGCKNTIKGKWHFFFAENEYPVLKIYAKKYSIDSSIEGDTIYIKSDIYDGCFDLNIDTKKTKWVKKQLFNN